ncbi:glycine cleavage system protein GcvH [Phormidesmis priestleyi]
MKALNFLRQSQLGDRIGTEMALEYPEDLKYLDTHEYVRLEGDTATVGISAFAIDQLGDIVFLELPEVGSVVEKGESFGTVESVKAVEDLKSPVTGTVVEANAALVDAPETLIDDPYVAGWLIKVQVDDPSSLDNALSAEEYRSQVEGA